MSMAGTTPSVCIWMRTSGSRRFAGNERCRSPRQGNRDRLKLAVARGRRPRATIDSGGPDGRSPAGRAPAAVLARLSVVGENSVLSVRTVEDRAVDRFVG